MGCMEALTADGPCEGELTSEPGALPAFEQEQAAPGRCLAHVSCVQYSQRALCSLKKEDTLNYVGVLGVLGLV